jgi:hypothetical protein
MTGQTRFLFAGAAGAIRRIGEKGAAGESDTEAISAALADDDGAKALAVALAHVVAHEPALVRALRDDVLPAVHRRLIGELCVASANAVGLDRLGRPALHRLGDGPTRGSISPAVKGSISASVDSH